MQHVIITMSAGGDLQGRYEPPLPPRTGRADCRRRGHDRGRAGIPSSWMRCGGGAATHSSLAAKRGLATNGATSSMCRTQGCAAITYRRPNRRPVLAIGVRQRLSHVLADDGAQEVPLAHVCERLVENGRPRRAPRSAFTIDGDDRAGDESGVLGPIKYGHHQWPSQAVLAPRGLPRGGTTSC